MHLSYVIVTELAPDFNLLKKDDFTRQKETAYCDEYITMQQIAIFLRV